ncbi:sigma-70 family RNA polymerase sigma factor [Butyricimonas sp.]|uniref:sigma-70 family RNA polymerase sigma factor n=1 Tax=Butyricimonas sp. TaxID=1969738 RepID=UPI0025C13BDF|nr:sigma-70 family RNA polymerase sigma factor [Butyricimonas sp.]
MLGRRNLEREFENMFKENYSRLCQYAYTYLNDKDASEDVVSEAFEYAWKKYKELKKDELFAVLVLRVKHGSMNYLRHRKAVDKYAAMLMKADREGEDLPGEDEDRIMRVEKVISTLPVQTRRVLEECCFNRKTYLETADLLGISRNTVKKHMMRVLELLREEFFGKNE